MQRYFGAVVVALLVACSAPAYAQERTFGAWVVGVFEDKSGMYAGTANDSGGMLFSFCYVTEGSCLWALVVSLECEQDSVYPVLINADTGAASTEVVCLKVNGKPRYVFRNFDLVDGSVRNSQRIGFASPLKNGQFTVSRFSLSGATDALSYLKKAMTVLKKVSDQGTSDQTL